MSNHSEQTAIGVVDSPELLCCVSCEGRGYLLGIFPIYADGYAGERKPVIEIPCDRCGGSGKMPQEHQRWIEEGAALKRERMSRQIGMRMEAERRGIDPSELSKMERGIIQPVISPPE